MATEAPVDPTSTASDAPSKKYSAAGDPVNDLPKPLPKPVGVGKKIFWTYAIAFTAVHALALLAVMPYLFSWSAVVVAVLGYFFIGAVGINLGYHRLLTHRGLIVPKWLEHTFAVLGVCNLQDAPARWVAIHRMHHQHSDHQPDPHSPWVDFFWGHVGWLVWQNQYFGTTDFYDRYARDLLKDPFYMRLERNLVWFWVYLAHAVAIYGIGAGIGYATTGTLDGAVQLGLSWLVWGVFVRTVAVWHVTWSVNSVTHLWGYENYKTKDHSKNNWIVALLTSGEGWHNNHHAYPRCASHGHRWWELDATYWFVLGLEKVGLAKSVVHPKAEHLTSEPS